MKKYLHDKDIKYGIPEKWDPVPYGGTLGWDPKVGP